MNQWTNKWMNEWVSEWVSEWVDEWEKWFEGRLVIVIYLVVYLMLISSSYFGEISIHDLPRTYEEVNHNVPALEKMRISTLVPTVHSHVPWSTSTLLVRWWGTGAVSTCFVGYRASIFTVDNSLHAKIYYMVCLIIYNNGESMGTLPAQLFGSRRYGRAPGMQSSPVHAVLMPMPTGTLPTYHILYLYIVIHLIYIYLISSVYITYLQLILLGTSQI